MAFLHGAPGGNENARRRRRRGTCCARTPPALVGDAAGPLAAVAVALGLEGLELGGGGLQERGGLGVIVLERRGVRRPPVEVEVAQPGRFRCGVHTQRERERRRERHE